MENKNIIIILIAIIIVLSVIVGAMFLQSINVKEPTIIKITSGNEQFEGGEVSIQLTDLNQTPIQNEIVKITISNKKGELNVNDTVKTDSKGKAKLDLDLKKGEYIVNVDYGGNKNYSGNNATQELTIKEEVVESQPSSSSASSDTYVERREGNLVYGYKDGRYGFWTPSGNFIEDKSRALRGEDPVEPFMRDGSFYNQM